MSVNEAEYVAPSSLREAFDVLAAGPRTVLAGGTDFYPARVGTPLTEPVLDLDGVAGLRGISTEEGRYRIGATTRWSDIVAADLPPSFDGLRAAATQVGGVQIQNVATVGGNLCNASPAADGVPPLLTLDASVELSSARHTREVALGDFILGNRRTALADDEILTAVLVPRAADEARSSFHKLGSRTYLVISIVMVAALVEVDSVGHITTARVAVGACSPVAKRLPSLEGVLLGRSVNDIPSSVVSPEHLTDLSPIDDVRGPAEYRRRAALALVQRAVDDCLGRIS